MARVVPAHDVGLPEGAGRARISTSRARRGKILAVEHPVFGWVKYREWALLQYVERLVERIGPMELVSWVGLTFLYAKTIQTAAQFADWVQKVAGDIGGFFTGLAGALSGAVSGALGPFFPPGTEIPESIDPLGLGGIGQGARDVLQGLTGFITDPVLKYFWAAMAAALTIMGIKRA